MRKNELHTGQSDVPQGVLQNEHIGLGWQICDEVTAWLSQLSQPSGCRPIIHLWLQMFISTGVVPMSYREVETAVKQIFINSLIYLYA